MEEKYESKNFIPNEHLKQLNIWQKSIEEEQQAIASTVAESLHKQGKEWSDMDIRQHEAKWQKLTNFKNRIRQLFSGHESVMHPTPATAAEILKFKKNRQAQENKDLEIIEKDWKCKDTFPEERQIKLYILKVYNCFVYSLVWSRSRQKTVQ